MTVTELPPPAEVGAAPVDGGRRARRLGQQVPDPPASAPSVGLPRADPMLEEERRVRRPLSTSRLATIWVLATVSLLAGWFVVYAVALTPVEESHRQAVLYHALREDLALQTAPLGGQIAPGTPVALLDVPAAGIADAVVVEGTASGDLMNGPGHKRDTVLPGQIGVSVLYGRASLFAGPFGGISGLHTGDTIKATTGQGVFTYVVKGIRRAGDPFPQPLAVGAGRLTLVSAEGNGRFGFLAPQAVVYVDAELNGQAQPTLPGRPAAVPKAEQAMKGDPSALLPLALALPLLLGAIVFVVWSRNRWGGWQTWVIGVPILVAALWATSQAAVQLLPNLL